MRRYTAFLGAAALAACVAPNLPRAECLSPLVAGGELPASDCQLEMHVVNPNNTPALDRRGRVNPEQTCRDGDPTCDADGLADGTCTFQLASCFDCVDPLLPTCTPAPTHSYAVFLPRLTSPRPVDVANAAALLAAAAALGGTPASDQPRVVEFDPPLGEGTCTALTPFKVPLRQSSAGARPTRTTLRSRALAPLGTSLRWDADFLRLVCLPAQ